MCIREVVKLLEGMQDLKTIIRKRVGYDELRNFAITQMPVAAVVSKLPIPTPKWSGRNHSTPDLFDSQFEISVTVFLSDASEEHDSELSHVADEMWRTLWSNLTLSGYAQRIEVKPESGVSVWPPYVAFRFLLIVHYQHNVGGL
jgi:hypothetical protein